VLLRDKIIFLDYPVFLSRGADSLCMVLLRGDPARVVRCAIKQTLLLPGLKIFLYVEELLYMQLGK
jgi:hypothetical protein